MVIISLAALALRFYRFGLPGSLANVVNPLATLPPGFDSDEAFHTLAAIRMIQSHEVVPFFTIDQGIPAAMIYLIALVFQFTGPVAESGRIVSEIMGVLILVLLPLTASQLIPNRRAFILLTAAQTALTFWFVHFSRIGLEQMTATALITLAVFVFWNWQQHGGIVRACLAGGALSLALYSYAAAYWLPVALGCYALYSLTLSQTRWRPRPLELAAGIITAAVLASPLVIFFIQNPDWAILRTSQVAAKSWIQLPMNFLRTVGTWVYRGSMDTKYNLDGRPLLDPVQATLFVLGLAYCIRHWRQASCGLLLIWLGVMVVPAALSSTPEHFGRLAGDVPAVMLVTGSGGAALWQWLNTRQWLSAQKIGWLACAVIFGAAMVYTAIQTAIAYFVIWPNLPGVLGTFQVPERVQAEQVVRSPNTSAYISPSDRERSMFAFLWQDQPLAKSFNGRACSVAPERTIRKTIWVLNTAPFEDNQTPERLRQLYPELATQIVFKYAHTPVVTQLSLPAGVQAKLPSGLIGRVDDLAELRSIQIKTAPARGKSLPMQLTWRVTASTTSDWTIGLYLLDPNLQLKAQDDRRPCDHSYPTFFWESGDIIVEDRTLDVPSDLAPGQYLIGLTFYRLSDSARAPTFDANNVPQGPVMRVQPISLP